jgi:hypothetical protein
MSNVGAMPRVEIQCRCGLTGVIAMIEEQDGRTVAWVEHDAQLRHAHTGADLDKLRARAATPEQRSALTSDDLGYSGAHLMRGAIEAIKVRPDLQDAIVEQMRVLAEIAETSVDAEPTINRLIELITAAGIVAPPLLSHRPDPLPDE